MAQARSRQNGFTLMEIMIGLGLMSVVLLGGYTAATMMGKEVISSLSDQTRANQIDVIRTHLKRFLSPGTLRLFAFSGQTPTGSPPDKTLARLLVPLPDLCADLTSCPGNTVMFYLSYPKPTSSAVRAVCDPNGDGSTNPTSATEIMVDLGDTTYGNASADSPSASYFNVTMSGQTNKIAVSPTSILGLENAPSVSMWISNGNPKQSVIDFTGNTFTDYDGSLKPISNSCTGQLGTGANIWIVPVVPFIALHQSYTGSSELTQGDLNTAEGGFPMRLVSYNLRSVGMAVELDTVHNVNRNMLVIRNCKFSFTGPLIQCGGTDFLNYGPINNVYIDESFNTPLANIITANHYEINGTSPVDATCISPDCVALHATDTAIPVILNAASSSPESLSALDGSQFSLLKQEALSDIRIKITYPYKVGSTQGFEDIIDVPIH